MSKIKINTVFVIGSIALGFSIASAEGCTNENNDDTLGYGSGNYDCIVNVNGQLSCIEQDNNSYSNSNSHNHSIYEETVVSPIPRYMCGELFNFQFTGTLPSNKKDFHINTSEHFFNDNLRISKMGIFMNSEDDEGIRYVPGLTYSKYSAWRIKSDQSGYHFVIHYKANNFSRADQYEVPRTAVLVATCNNGENLLYNNVDRVFYDTSLNVLEASISDRNRLNNFILELLNSGTTLSQAEQNTLLEIAGISNSQNYFLY